MNASFSQSTTGIIILGAIGSFLAWAIITLAGRFFGRWLPAFYTSVRNRRGRAVYAHGFVLGVITESQKHYMLPGYFAYHLAVLLIAITGLIFSGLALLLELTSPVFTFSTRPIGLISTVAIGGGFLLFFLQNFAFLRLYYQHEIVPILKIGKQNAPNLADKSTPRQDDK